MFPALGEELGELNEKQKEFVRAVELMDLPNCLSFSRAFTQFAESELPQQIHEGMVKKYLGAKLVGHISRDSTPKLKNYFRSGSLCQCAHASP